MRKFRAFNPSIVLTEKTSSEIKGSLGQTHLDTSGEDISHEGDPMNIIRPPSINFCYFTRREDNDRNRFRSAHSKHCPDSFRHRLQSDARAPHCTLPTAPTALSKKADILSMSSRSRSVICFLSADW